MSISDLFKGDGYGRDGKNHGFASPKNTTGVVVGDGKTAAEAKKAKEVAKAKGANLAKLTKDELEAILFVLDIAGVIPGVGMVADGAAGVIRASTGDWGGAFYSLLGFVPLAGDVLKGGDLAIRIAKNPKFYLGQLQKAQIAVAKLGNEYKKVADFFNKQYKKIEDFIYSKAPKGSLPPRKGDGTGSKGKDKNQKNDKKCPKTCKPVNPILGIKILLDDEDVDFILSGDLPLLWSRQYASDSLIGRGKTGDPDGWFGQGWGNNWGEQLNILPEQDLIEYIDTSGRAINFPCIAIGKSVYLRNDDIRLHHDAIDQYRITSGVSETGDGIQLHFSNPNTNNLDNELLSYPRKQRLYCTAQSDNYDNRITLEYHSDTAKAHLPQYIKDSAGRLLQLDFVSLADSKDNSNNQSLRLQQISELTHLSNSQCIDLLSKLDKKSQQQLQQAHHTSIGNFLNQINEFIDTGKLTKKVLDTQTLVTYIYNEQGDLIEVNPYLNPTRRFDYKNHIMTAHHTEDGVSSYYEYDEYLPSGKVLFNPISNGQTYHFNYQNDYTIVTEAKDTANERQTLYHFDQDQRWTGVTDALGNRTSFVLDDYNRPIQIISSDGSITENQYAGDTLVAVKQLIDYEIKTNLPLWRTQKYLYNNNRLTELLDPLGNATRLTYDAAGQIKHITDANGNSTHIERDNKGRTTRQILANGSSFSYEYNHQGELIEQTDCSGYPTRYEYDNLGRVIQVTDAQGNITRLTYDHRIDGVIQHTASPTHIHYPDGSGESFVYDSLNRLIKHTDAKEQVTEYQYTDDSLPIRRIDALGHTLDYEYDNLRRLITLTNENGQHWIFTYDAADNLISETRFDGYTSHYDYDKNGQLIHQTDNPSGKREEQKHTYLQRDLLGQLTFKHSLDIIKPNATALQRHHKTQYQYDLAGQLICATSPDASTHLEYDNIGQLISERLTRHHQRYKDTNNDNQDSHIEQTLTHSYDEIGNRLKTTLPDGKVINQLYYGSGHLYNQSITDNEGSITEIRHSARNALHQETTRQQGQLLSSFGYDAMGRLTKQYSSDHNKGHIVIDRDYHYDVLGQLTHLSGQTQLNAKANNISTANSSFKRNHQYQYDKVGRLTEHKLTDYTKQKGTTEHFAFDPASNRVPVATADQNNDVASNITSNAASNIHKSGRPTELTTHDKYITYTYDKHGRVLFKTQTPLGSDGRPLKQSNNSITGYLESLQLYYTANGELERSIKTHQQGFDVTVTTTYYSYDAFGRRIAKSSDIQKRSKLTLNKKFLKHSTIQSTPTQSQTTLVLWDGNRQAQEYTDTHVFTTVYEQDSFEPVARLVWLKDGLTLAANDEGWYGNNKPEPPSAIQIYHYHNDHLGTPNELTNSQGEVVWLADYEAWGNTARVVWREESLSSIKVSADELQPIRFQGQSFDVETGLHYNRFRYYDPDLGMFTSRDPIGLGGGSNIFAYAPNPTGWVDPLGLAKKKECNTAASRLEVIANTTAVVKLYEPAIKEIDPNARVGIRGSTASGYSAHKGTNWSHTSDIDAYIASSTLPKGAYGRTLPSDLKLIESAIDKQLKIMMPCNGKTGEKLFSFKVQLQKFPENAAKYGEKIIQILD